MSAAARREQVHRRLPSLRPERGEVDAVGDRGVISEFGDDHPAIGVTDEDDGFPYSLHGLLHDLRVGGQVAERCRVGPSARQLLDHLDAMPSLPQPVGDLAPVPAADPAAVDEDEVRHRASVVPVTDGNNQPTGPGRKYGPRHLDQAFGSGQRLRGVGDADRGETFGVLGLSAQRDQRLLQSGDLTEPDPVAGFGDPLGRVRLELAQQQQPAGLRPQHGAPDTSFSALRPFGRTSSVLISGPTVLNAMYRCIAPAVIHCAHEFVSGCLRRRRGWCEAGAGRSGRVL
jgi:hypothetical protein